MTAAARRLPGPLLAALAAASVLFAPSLPRATVLFTEDFESGSGLNDGKWQSGAYRYSGTIAAGGGRSGTNGITFTQQVAYGYGDTWSIRLAVQPLKKYWISVDYRLTGFGGEMAVEEYNAGGTDFKDTWIFSSSASPGLRIWDGAGTGYNHYIQSFTTQATTVQIDLVLMDDTDAGMPKGSVFMDNIQVTDTPPTTPVQWQEVVK